MAFLPGFKLHFECFQINWHLNNPRRGKIRSGDSTEPLQVDVWTFACAPVYTMNSRAKIEVGEGEGGPKKMRRA